MKKSTLSAGAARFATMMRTIASAAAASSAAAVASSLHDLAGDACAAERAARLDTSGLAAALIGPQLSL